MCGDVPNDSTCASDDECSSCRCFPWEGIPGVCGECIFDADCEKGGCTPPPFSQGLMPQGAVCNEGELGDGCETDAACQLGLTCVEVLDMSFVWTRSSCSECVVDDDCTDDEVCAPTYDVLGFAGYYSCVEPKTRALGEGCDLDGSAGASCESLSCAPAQVMGLTVIGVCNPCDSADDCSDGDVCTLPYTDGNMQVVVGACTPV
jgi:hypothetical protein